MRLRCGLLGKKLGHSYSPQIHSQLGDYEYRLYERSPEELEAFLTGGDWDGLNVTIPYKKDVVPYCSELTDVARASGSVNTLVRRPDGSIFGDNTDAWGFWFLLKHNSIDSAGKKALILGNGGACASVRFVLEHCGAETVVISRRGPDNYENLDRHRDASLIVNTTPVGMFPHNGESPMDLRAFPRLEAVLDIIYNPARTALMLQAEERGIRTDNGLYMLVAQAYQSARDFQMAAEGSVGQKGNEAGLIQRDHEAGAIEKIEEIYAQLSFQMHNLILIGMPGSGKSTIAKLLGEMTGRAVLELDDLFTERFGITPERCILERGEEAFRLMETEVIRSAGQGSGQILSTGGGCVTRPENYPLLHQNGQIIWIRRELSELESEGRPLSQRMGAEEMYRIRRPLYEAFAEFSVINEGEVQHVAEEILVRSQMSQGSQTSQESQDTQRSLEWQTSQTVGSES